MKGLQIFSNEIGLPRWTYGGQIQNNKIRMLNDNFVFDNVNKYTMETRSKQMCLNGIT